MVLLDAYSLAMNQSFADIDHEFTETADKGHGRLERRRYWLPPVSE